MMKKWASIYIHNSDSEFGSSSLIDNWHIEKGWTRGGYHFDILNGAIAPDFYIPAMDGSIEVVRPIDGDDWVEKNEQGAHVLGMNDDSIGICLIGVKDFTDKQITSLILLLKNLMDKFGIELHNVRGHYEVDPLKTCPNMDIVALRKILPYVFKTMEVK